MRAAQLMRAAFLLSAVLFALVSGPAPAAPPLSRAYVDFVARFWRATNPGGHFAQVSPQLAGSACVSAGVDICTQTGAVGEGLQPLSTLWEYMIAERVLFAQYKVSGSADALTKLQTLSAYFRLWGSVTNANSCGASGGTNRTGTTLDDSAWVFAGFLDLYEATGDAQMLVRAEAAFDCAWTAFHDASAGGLWYESAQTDKSADAANFALAMVRLYQDGGATTSFATNFSNAQVLSNAQTLVTWIAANLSYSGNSQCPNSAHLLFMNLNVPGGISGCSHPFTINMTSSPTGLAGNMGWASVNALLYNITSTSSYLTEAQAAAASILTYENVSGAILDDRDARIGGFEAYSFALNVVPLLTAAARQSWVATYLATAQGVVTSDRQTTAEYGGDWALGPATGGVWDLAGYSSSRLEISAGAAMWPVTAQLWFPN